MAERPSFDETTHMIPQAPPTNVAGIIMNQNPLDASSLGTFHNVSLWSLLVCAAHLMLHTSLRADDVSDYEMLTAGLTNFPVQCCPGSVVVYGRTAVLVLVEPTGDQLVLEAAGYYGDDILQARGVAFAHDQWGWASDARINVAENAVRWASRKTNPAEITVGIGPGLNTAHFIAQGYNVKNVTTTMDSPANDLSGCDVFMAHWYYGYSPKAVSKVVAFAAEGGGNEGKQRVAFIDVSGTNHFSITLPVRVGADFRGSPIIDAMVDGIIYRFYGGAELGDWTWPVSEVIPAYTTGLPPCATLTETGVPIGCIGRSSSMASRRRRVICAPRFPKGHDQHPSNHQFETPLPRDGP